MQGKQKIDNLFQSDIKKKKKKVESSHKQKKTNKSLLTIDKPVNNSFKKIVQLSITASRNKVDKTNTQTIEVASQLQTVRNWKQS